MEIYLYEKVANVWTELHRDIKTILLPFSRHVEPISGHRRHSQSSHTSGSVKTTQRLWTFGNNQNSEASALARDQNNKTSFAVNDEAENCD